MTKNGIEPDADTYAGLLFGYARHGESNRITSLIGKFVKFCKSFGSIDFHLCRNMPEERHLP